jgi:enolase-phosphatase E1
MDRDRKSPGLKALQGLIWREGYESGALHGRVYPDVPAAFRRWRDGGLDIYIYSSGSVLAQKLLFGSTEWGDLTTSLSGFFDTAVGAKTAAASYRAILERVRVAAAQMLFVSDIVQELDAARTVGLHTALCVRGSAEPAAPAGHAMIRTLDEIEI